MKVEAKLLKLNSTNKEVPELEWVVNMSSGSLSIAKHNTLQKSLNYNIADAG